MLANAVFHRMTAVEVASAPQLQTALEQLFRPTFVSEKLTPES